MSAANPFARMLLYDEVYEVTPGDIRREVSKGPVTSAPPTTSTPPAADLFRRWTMPELIAAETPPTWQVRGLLMDGTYGMAAGSEKTLKTYVETFIGVAIASGIPLFDRFPVDRPGPWVTYVGEGGRLPWTRRLRRIAEAMDLDPSVLPIFPTFDVAPILSDRFRESLVRDLRETDAGHVTIDPLYAFHGSATDSRSLHHEGQLLTALSEPCTAARATLTVVNHFNQTGTGTGLQRITGAGAAEWCDTWLLVNHREPPDVAAGRFRLQLDIGSRQWGGANWDLDLSIGRFNPDAGTHDGAITWDLRQHDTRTATGPALVAAIVAGQPGELTREELAKAIGGNAVKARRTVDVAAEQGLVRAQEVPGRRSDGRTSHARRYFPTSTSDVDGRPTTDE